MPLNNASSPAEKKGIAGYLRAAQQINEPVVSPKSSSSRERGENLGNGGTIGGEFDGNSRVVSLYSLGERDTCASLGGSCTENDRDGINQDE